MTIRRPMPQPNRRSATIDTLVDERSDDREPADSERLAPRPRRRWLTPASAALLAAVTCAVGFYVGVRVEKSAAGSPQALRSAAAGPAARAGAGGGGFAAAASGRGSSFAARLRGAGRAGGAGGPGGPGGASAGTIASVDGRTLVVDETSGDAVKVRLTAATKITKTESAGRDRLHPGDTVVVSGVSGRNGTISAASLTDAGAGGGAGLGGSGAGLGGSGAGSAGGAGSGGTGSAGSGGSGSAIGSLFSGG